MPMYAPELVPPPPQQPPPGPQASNGAMGGAPMGAQQAPTVGNVQLGQQGAVPRQDAMSMANQIYVTQQQLTVVMQELAAMRQRRRSLDFTVNRDQDGRIISITAMEGQ